MNLPRCHSANRTARCPPARRVRAGGRVALLVQVLRQDRRFRRGEGGHHVGRRLRQLEHRGQLVGRLDALEVGEGRPAARVVLLQDLLERVLHVGRGEGRAVVPLHAVAQLEGDAARIVRHGPGRRQGGHRIELAVVGDQAVHHLGRDLLHHLRAVERGDQRRRLGRERPAQRAAGVALGLRRTRPGREGSQAAGLEADTEAGASQELHSIAVAELHVGSSKAADARVRRGRRGQIAATTWMEILCSRWRSLATTYWQPGGSCHGTQASQRVLTSSKWRLSAQ